MELLIKWLTRADGQRAVLTVVWNPDRVSLCLWGPCLQGKRSCMGKKEIPGNSCSWKRFREALHEMLKGRPGLALMVRWAMIEEVFSEKAPPVGIGEQAAPCLPVWMRSCMGNMPFRYYADSMTSGLKALAAGLSDWPDFAQTGTGIVFELEKRLVFLGRGSGGDFIQRISRDSGGNVGDSGSGISGEWIRQTKSFYRMRTGTELRNLIMGRYPDEWGTGPAGWEDFLHQVLSHAGSGIPEIIGKQALARLRQPRRLMRHFQGASLLAAASLALTLNGACRQMPDTRSMSEPESLDWIREKKRWEDANRVWQADRSESAQARFPYDLVGKIATSLPERVVLDRIHIIPADGKEIPRSLLEIEGRIEGAAQTAEIRDWIRRLPEISANDRIRNLRYSREEGFLRFAVSSTVRREGP